MSSPETNREPASQSRARPKLEFDVHGISDVGLVRQDNEDAFIVLPEHGLFIVADGIGGAAAGQAASQIAVELVHVKLVKRLGVLRRNAARNKVEAVVCETLQEVNDAMIAQSQRHAGLAGMGTTIVLALLWKGLILVAHLGDSRAHIYRDGELELLTEDHALAAQLARWGKITESQVDDNPGRSTLLRYLGANEEPRPDITWSRPVAGCWLLLSTDGLTNMVSDAEIARIVGPSESAETCCRTLVTRANTAGGKDNTTVIAVRFFGMETASRKGSA